MPVPNNDMQYEQVYAYLMPKLENELAAYLQYHNAAHTKAVIAAAEDLAAKENISGNDLIILGTAALFHDAGFLQQEDDHEEISCIIARDHLPDFGYSDSQIEHICRMIMATRLPQSPTDHLSEILCDADVFYIGTDRYAANEEKMYREFKHRGIIQTEAEWVLPQVEFLSSHNYF